MLYGLPCNGQNCVTRIPSLTAVRAGIGGTPKPKKPPAALLPPHKLNTYCPIRYPHSQRGCTIIVLPALLRSHRETITSGETHEQICYPASDTCHIRDGTGGGSYSHPGQGRDEQRQGYKEENEEDPKESWRWRSQSGVVSSIV